MASISAGHNIKNQLVVAYQTILRNPNNRRNIHMCHAFFSFYLHLHFWSQMSGTVAYNNKATMFIIVNFNENNEC